MGERLYKLKVEAIDEFSATARDNKKKELEMNMHNKQYVADVKENLGVDISPQNPEEVMDSQEEVDLFMELRYKPRVEIAVEKAVNLAFKMNDYANAKHDVLEDLVVLGIGGSRHYTDPEKGIINKRVDPADIVHAYPTHRNFKEVYYYGEVRRITINELRRVAPDRFTDEELNDMAKSSSEWHTYNRESNQYHYREDDIDGFLIDVLDFTFKATNTVNYKKKHNKNGSYNMTKKESSFSAPDGEEKGYESS